MSRVPLNPPAEELAGGEFPPGVQALVVDDEPVIRMLARMSLTKAGFGVTEAGDAGQAAEAVRTAARPFDLVLLDLTLPGAGGAELIPEFRTKSPTMRILVVSGLAEEDAAGLGADGFLGKPFTRVTLLDAVRRVMRQPSRSA